MQTRSNIVETRTPIFHQEVITKSRVAREENNCYPLVLIDYLHVIGVLGRLQKLAAQQSVGCWINFVVDLEGRGSRRLFTEPCWAPRVPGPLPFPRAPCHSNPFHRRFRLRYRTTWQLLRDPGGPRMPRDAIGHPQGHSTSHRLLRPPWAL